MQKRYKLTWFNQIQRVTFQRIKDEVGGFEVDEHICAVRITGQSNIIGGLEGEFQSVLPLNADVQLHQMTGDMFGMKWKNILCDFN